MVIIQPEANNDKSGRTAGPEVTFRIRGDITNWKGRSVRTYYNQTVQPCLVLLRASRKLTQTKKEKPSSSDSIVQAEDSYCYVADSATKVFYIQNEPSNHAIWPRPWERVIMKVEIERESERERKCRADCLIYQLTRGQIESHIEIWLLEPSCRKGQCESRDNVNNKGE